ncbi:hypothetical protein H696_02708 [Fonticula alba]|uniref:ATP synthase subunit O, mitochondrial n=1 Tax=Fonticula alba TaxID=691883 RepID=A0A058Z7V0_FONAL|nr:hypothetical protein H696_02708 [Fonticula alba]KCV70374.1 hypothetical protein H696_02708 [Fonticula alba]|eukprot:XP_009494890.1 hypothetical protein H696_02708 [Fonticula alba]
MNAATLNVVRRYATQASVQVPLRLFSLEGRYATAFYTASVKSNTLPKVEEDIKSLKSALSTDKHLSTFFASPLYSTKLKVEGAKDVASKLKVQPQTANLLTVMAENGRLSDMSKVIGAFEEIMAAHRNEVEVVITSAHELDAKVRAQIEAIVKKKFIQPKQTIRLVTEINPSILGGFVVRVGESSVDLSVSSQVNKIHNALSQPL